MSLGVRLLLIPATWLLAWLIGDYVSLRGVGLWALPLVLALGCSGSIVAVLNP